MLELENIAANSKEADRLEKIWRSLSEHGQQPEFLLLCTADGTELAKLYVTEMRVSEGTFDCTPVPYRKYGLKLRLV